MNLENASREKLLSAVESVLALCDDPGGPDSWSHLFDGRQSVFVDDIRRAITDALGGGDDAE